MSYRVSGHEVETMSCTWSWGLAPGSFSATIPGNVSVGSCGTDITVDFGGWVFAGVISSRSVLTDDGFSTQIQAVDHRLKLMWDMVYCQFNQVEVRADDPATPGIDRQRRFAHILPDFGGSPDWTQQKVTYTTEPYSASEIIDWLLSADSVQQDWTAEPHDDQDAPVLGLDWNMGTKLGNALQELAERQGLVFTFSNDGTAGGGGLSSGGLSGGVLSDFDGPDAGVGSGGGGGGLHLYFERKGEGTVPSPPAHSTARRDGTSLTNLDEHITAIGDRNLFQDIVEIVPDWVRTMEQFWSAPLWWKEVDRVYGPYAADEAGQAELSAKAQSVTMREYATDAPAAHGPVMDRDLWGEVSRAEIPAWLYLRDIVFKVYRVPPGYTIDTSQFSRTGKILTLDSLHLHEGLLAAVDLDIDNGGITIKDPKEYYPEAQAFVFAKGQPLAMLDPRTQRSITAVQLAAAREKWQPVPEFKLDTKNNTVILDHATFLPGTGPAGLFVFPTEGKDGITAEHPLANMIVPNAGVEVSAAEVRAVLVWEGPFYTKEFGSGKRRGAAQIKGVSDHYVFEGIAGSTTKTHSVPYADGKEADDKADTASFGRTGQESYAHGGYTRHGSWGTVLSGVVDRVTTTISFSEGLVEVVEFTKERPAGAFENARDLDRKSRQKDLFPGLQANKTEVEQLRAIARIKRERPARAAGYANPAEVLQKPVGAATAPVNLIEVPEEAAAGTPLFGTQTVGETVTPTHVFLGVVVADKSVGKQVAVATSGTVLVRVQGPFVAGDPVGVFPPVEDPAGLLETFARTFTGSETAEDARRVVGVVNESYEGTDIVVVPVRLGATANVAAPIPLGLIKVSDTEIRVRRGSVQSGGTFTAPGFGDGDVPPFLLTVSGGVPTGRVFMSVTVDAVTGAVTAATDPEIAETVPADSDPSFYLELGSFTTTDGVLTVQSNDVGAQSFELCGGVTPQWGPV